MAIMAMFFAAGWVISKFPDCGQMKYRQRISVAESLVVSREPLNIPVTEMPKGRGEMECARLEFSINKFGHAVNVSVAESSGSYVMTTSAIRAIECYKFRVPPNYKKERYTIALRGNVGAAPPYP